MLFILYAVYRIVVKLKILTQVFIKYQGADIELQNQKNIS